MPESQQVPYIDAKEAAPQWTDWELGSSHIKKIVVGELGEDKQIPGTLPPDLVERFPGLTHLHLWGLKELDSLPTLPRGLECLDLRNCTGIERIEALPESLETLDLGGCSGLTRLTAPPPRNLLRLYLSKCTGLKRHHFETFFEDLSAGDLRELDATGCTALESVEGLPLSLRKLVLRDCTGLYKASRITQMHVLDHLDLRGCTELRALEGLPASVRFLALHGAEKLARFMDQDIGPYDRGTDEGQNVAAGLHSRRKFGEHLTASAHAKLLLLGDGRMGKTTLAKRLQWETLDSAQKAANPDLEPMLEGRENPTHRMRHWSWSLPVSIPEVQLDSLRARARARQVDLPLDDQERLRATIGLWDFGGQEIYHNTHRIFAGEGSVFLIVWRARPLEAAEVDRHCPEGCDLAIWRELNRQRPLDYWLDYIDSVRPGAKVALVCTCTPEKDNGRIPWGKRAPRHAHRNLPCFYVDSLEEGVGNSQDFKSLMRWIEKECGNEAVRIGPLQPTYYSEVASELKVIREEARAAFERGDKPEQILTWENWKRRVADSRRGIPLDNSDVESITGYLHDAGQLFWLRRRQEQAVLVDLEWATEHIYEMLKPGGALYRKIRSTGGWLPMGALEAQDHWSRIKSDLQRERLLELMEQCNILVRAQDKSESRSGQTIFVANEKWLLMDPAEPELQRRLDARWQLALEQGLDRRDDFALEGAKISEFAFHELMALLGRHLGRGALWFRGGLQAMPDDQSPDWCLWVNWIPEREDAFFGHVDLRLLSRKGTMDEVARELEQVLTQPGSPLARYGRPARRESRHLGLDSQTMFLRPGKEEVGVSSRGKDSAEAEMLVQALKANGLLTYWYLDEESREGDFRNVQEFMENRLRRAPCLVLLLSDRYLENDPEHNLYCAWEIADAIIQWKENNRTIERTLVLYLPHQRVTSTTLADVLVELFQNMAEHFASLYRSKPVESQMNFQYYNDIAMHFRKALEGGRVAAFKEKRGNQGWYPHVFDAGGVRNYDALIQEIRKVLGKH